jgi:diguanylate cyclase (GGDEF)-like protein/PAS domain S-box-containing protein
LDESEGIDAGEARAIRTRLQAIYDVVPVGITITDPEGHIIDCNPASETLLGITREEHLSRRYDKGWEIFDEDGQPMPPERFASVRALTEGSEIRDQLMEVRHPDGRSVWLSVSASPVLRDGIGVVIAYVNVSELVDASRQIQRLALHDALTELPNHTLCLDLVDQLIRSARRHDEQVAALHLDLDKFREINETLGHGTGDHLLKLTAARLRELAGPNDVVARFSGDEFLLAAPGGDPGTLARQVLEVVATPVETARGRIVLTASIGIACFPEDAGDAAELLRHADIAMTRSKASRNRHSFYNADMGRQVEETLNLARDLDGALENGDLQLVFQPQFDLASRSINGAEVLLRWHHPQRGWISPAEFIPIAEKRGMMTAVGEWVMRRACQQLHDWGRLGLKLPGRLAINVSAQQFDHPDFIDRTADIVRAANVTPESLEIELTENSVAVDPERATQVLHAFQEMGMGLALDDFGIGYSSLTYLRQFEVHKLKIDGSFIQKMVELESERTIVATIIGMARTLGLRTLAEGVETAEQADLLAELGCQSVQGFLFGYPVAADEFAREWLGKPAQKEPA